MTSQKIPQYNKRVTAVYCGIFREVIVSFIMFKFYEVIEETLQ